MITPREDFRKSSNGSSWNDVVDSVQFNEAAKTALLEYSRALTTDTATAGLKMQGAHEFLRVLMHLCETQKERPGVSTSLNLTPTK